MYITIQSIAASAAAVLLAAAASPNATAAPSDELSLMTPASASTSSPSIPPRKDYIIGLSLYWDNDGNFTRHNGATDRHYTSGTGIAIQWQNPATSRLISSIPSLGDEFSPNKPSVTYAGGILASLNMYTPEDLKTTQPVYDDHPYAGLTYGGIVFQRANRAANIPTLEQFELDLGTIGPTGQAGKVQEWVHQTFGYTYPEGWGNEIRDPLGIDLRYQRRWRLDLLSPSLDSKAGIQLIPEAGATLGTFHDNLQAGATLRAGWNMPDDFGTARLRYPGDFTRKFGHISDLRWSSLIRDLGAYLYLRPGERYVAHDSTIEGSFFRHSTVELDAQPFVTEIQVGAALLLLNHIELGYSQTYTSREYIGQHDWDAHGSITISYVLAW